MSLEGPSSSNLQIFTAYPFIQRKSRRHTEEIIGKYRVKVNLGIPSPDDSPVQLPEIPEDPELEKIKSLTNALENNIKNRISTYKDRRKSYLENLKNLNDIVKNYEKELGEVKASAISAVVLSSKNCEEINKIKQSVALSGKSDKIYKESLNRGNHEEIIQELINEISIMNQKILENEMIAEQKTKENTELKETIEKMQDKKGIVDTSKVHSSCNSCKLF